MPADEPIVQAQNRTFRYGEGLFETILLAGESIRLKRFHFERLFNGLRILEFDIPPDFNSSFLAEQMLILCKRNKHLDSARIRIQVFREKFGVSEPGSFPKFVIESVALDRPKRSLNEKGLTIGLYPHGKKSVDDFSNLKTCNYLPYTMAAQFAGKMGWDDSLVLNSYSRICDSSIANVYCVKNKIIFTPALEEGSIAGVMRRYLFDSLPLMGFTIREEKMTAEFLSDSDEIFLTNAIRGLLWVEKFESRKYTNKLAREIFTGIFENSERMFNI